MVDSANRSAPTFEAAVAEASALLEGIARALVNLPERVVVEQVLEDGVGKLILRVDPTDLARITGAGGRTQNSLRTVIKAAARKTGASLSLQIEIRNP